MNAIELSLFVSRMEAICEEMGSVLRRTALSPNIKDRLDFSCALFDASGELCAQAAHIPVHLGSMAYAMADIVNQFNWQAGDVVVLNDPFLGGTHLPDVTIVAPFFTDELLQGFVVNRAHHANIGSDSPGSMPNSTTLEEEGVVIAPQFLFRQGELNIELWQRLKPLHAPVDPDSNGGSQARNAEGNYTGNGKVDSHAEFGHAEFNAELSTDMAAQVSSVKVGVHRSEALLALLGAETFQLSLNLLNDYGERLATAALAQIPPGHYYFEDVMDDDGQGHEDIKIALSLRISKNNIVADFSGTASQVEGNINCPLSVAAAAVFYVFRCLMPVYTPSCAGIFRHISLVASPGCLVNAQRPAAVVAGNVETSSRIVDVVLGALQQALPDIIPAASQGSMNNVAMGNHNQSSNWDYYETIAGGQGAGPRFNGLSAAHSHMTNTLNTPVESVEMHYPLRILQYGIRRGSGGPGKHAGGDGICREYEFLEETQVSLLTERRKHAPWGCHLGGKAEIGKNLLNGKLLPSKTSFIAQAGDRLTILTPGGGGWGKLESHQN